MVENNSSISMPVKRLDFWTPENLDLIWPKIKHSVGSVDPDFPAYYIKEQLESGQAQLWTVISDRIEAYTVTSIESFPEKKVCTLWIAAGESLGFVDYLPEIENWAIQNECVEMRIYGRRGWTKILGDYDEDLVTLKKRLTNGQQENGHSDHNH